MLKETLKWLLLVGLTVGLFGCDDGNPPLPTKNEYAEELLVEMPNGCSMFAYTVKRAGQRWTNDGRFVTTTEALSIALKSGQYTGLRPPDGVLTPELLWGVK